MKTKCAIVKIRNRHGFGPYYLWQARIVDNQVHLFEFDTKREAVDFVNDYTNKKGELKMEIVEEEVTQEYIYDELAKCMATEYANYIADEILESVREDVIASAGAEPNEDDIRLAIGRAICYKLGISV